jgi:hypothetical protein
MWFRGAGGELRSSAASAVAMRRLPVRISFRATTGEPPVLACALNGATWSWLSSIFTVASVSWASRPALARDWSSVIAPIAISPSTSTTAGAATLRSGGSARREKGIVYPIDRVHRLHERRPATV